MRRTGERRTQATRRGLAPLEFVLALPLMLFVMALIIDFGAVAGWRLRSQINTRYAGWRTANIRTGGNDPAPWFWPANEPLQSGTGNPVQQETLVWPQLPEVSMVRGPVVADPNSGQTISVRRQLEMSAGTHVGATGLRRRIPLFRTLLPGNGTFGFDLSQEFLDRRWEYHDLGYGANDQRRAKAWWMLEPTEFDSDLLDLKVRADDVHQRMADLSMGAAFAPIDVLDRDDEWQQYTGNSRQFHPYWNPNQCEIDANRIYGSPQYRQLVTQVTKLPGSMARDFIGLYQGEINRLMQQTPPPMGQIGPLQQKIAQLNRFLAAVPPRYK